MRGVRRVSRLAVAWESLSRGLWLCEGATRCLRDDNKKRMLRKPLQSMAGNAIVAPGSTRPQLMRQQLCLIFRQIALPLCLACGGVWACAQQFVQPMVIPTGNWPSAVFNADVNGDGTQDLVYMDYGATPASSTTHVLLNDGKGNFTPVGDCEHDPEWPCRSGVGCGFG